MFASGQSGHPGFDLESWRAHYARATLAFTKRNQVVAHGKNLSAALKSNLSAALKSANAGQ